MAVLRAGTFSGLGRTVFGSTVMKLVPRFLSRAVLWVFVGVTLSQVGGCGLLAFPCRAVAATVKIVPGVGHAAAVPFDGCAAAID